MCWEKARHSHPRYATPPTLYIDSTKKGGKRYDLMAIEWGGDLPIQHGGPPSPPAAPPEHGWAHGFGDRPRLPAIAEGHGPPVAPQRHIAHTPGHAYIYIHVYPARRFILTAARRRSCRRALSGGPRASPCGPVRVPRGPIAEALDLCRPSGIAGSPARTPARSEQSQMNLSNTLGSTHLSSKLEMFQTP